MKGRVNRNPLYPHSESSPLSVLFLPMKGEGDCNMEAIKEQKSHHMVFSCPWQFQVPVGRLPSERCCRTPPPGSRAWREMPSLVAASPALHTFLQPPPFKFSTSFLAATSSHDPPQGKPTHRWHPHHSSHKNPAVFPQVSHGATVAGVLSCGRHCRMQIDSPSCLACIMSTVPPFACHRNRLRHMDHCPQHPTSSSTPKPQSANHVG
jgi:hypothetical protein